MLGSLMGYVRSAVGLDPRQVSAGGTAPHVNRAKFTAAVVGLSAKLSKSDGVTLKIEADTFERLFAFPEAELGNVRRLFNLAAGDTAGFESYATEISRSLSGDPELKRNVFDALLHIASADGILHAGEDKYLASVADIFGYTTDQYKAARARFVQDTNDPYEILSVSREMTNAALKAHYLKLVREHHPDALAAKGLAQELRQVSDRKLATINAAWDVIARERGL